MNSKEDIFIEEYLKDFNASRACRRAGYSSKNADKIGHQLLGKTRVQEKLRKKREEISKRNDASIDRVLQELKLLAFSRMGDILPEIEDRRFDDEF